MEGPYQYILTDHGDRIVLDPYMTHKRCARRGCKTTIVFIDNGSSDCGEEFEARNCRCQPQKYCCPQHIRTHVCVDCVQRE